MGDVSPHRELRQTSVQTRASPTGRTRPRHLRRLMLSRQDIFFADVDNHYRIPDISVHDHLYLHLVLVCCICIPPTLSILGQLQLMVPSFS